MKVVILAGGLGTRIAEETETRPKPMVEIGGSPILWHILKHFAHHGFREFIIALGYKGEVIKRFFIDQHRLSGSRTINLRSGEVVSHDPPAEDWLLHLMETGHDTLTGGRVKRLSETLRGGPFIVTYGDGVSNVDIGALLSFHREQGLLATVTAVRPPARFGGLIFDGDRVARFTEKPQAGEGWINGGYLVLEPGVLDWLEGDHSSLEADLLERLAAAGQLAAYKHHDFWQCMDTLRDKHLLDALWSSGRAPWKVWQ